ncbi:trypsin [Rhodanobacter thiooxydans]|uniref:Trypsin n=1 Tax=Rhodanobacter thiooxydans TaxID=416169 RepID=A0A154QJ90_9GAMM|nr:trypsin-like serine protease [Rhodanobacter thiooxydans]EIM02148.1 serine endopeptidase [Rhodanobacter thiooxydans LCS2]KZC24259.1 trypsin [Rhodanobacter thiooxydans]MCW0203509.1 trypsin-like serine protease [Rhodanobacter thiooxydans]
MRRLLLVVLLAISSTAGAVVIRSDVNDAKYRVPASAFPALVDMPGEGHGVLIAARWVVTAAHAAPMQMQGMEDEVSIGGVARRVKRVITYPGYRKLPDQLIKEALASGDLSKVHAFLASSDDIALIELASPVTDVTPVPLYRGNKEVGMTAQLVGKGATGNGVEGQDSHSPHRTVLRRAFNVVVGADARYVWYRFDPPASALPLEGIMGSGDSGGPLITGGRGSRQLVGLASWSKYPAGHPFWSRWAPGRPFVEGLYGAILYGVRISSYIQWIEGVISAPANARTRLQPAEANQSAGNSPTPPNA